MNIRIEAVRPVHVHQILPHLRDRECKIIAGVSDPAAALIKEIGQSSQAFAVLFDDQVVCLWGIHVRSILADAVCLWMLTSRAVEEHPIVFIRQSRRMREAMLADYAVIEGIVAIDNPVSIRWLGWLGASFESSAVPGMLDFRLRRAAA